MRETTLAKTPSPTSAPPLKLGFAGVGWIGRNRLEHLASTGRADVTAIMDPNASAVAEVIRAHPTACAVNSFEALLDHDLDGIVIATPSALHASQALIALAHELPVFCQKPLGRNAHEAGQVISAARSADLLLGVDLSYRHTHGMSKVRKLVQDGTLGDIIAVDTVFHNAYGPDKDWFYSRELAGGGCLLDLGIHLIDLALWCLDFPQILSARGWTHESSRGTSGDKVEDYATGTIITASGTCIQLACSWGSHAGCDAEIRITIHGTRGGASFRNRNGSFYDFQAEHFQADRSRLTVSAPPDDWNGRAINGWLGQLARSSRFDPTIERLGIVASTIDQLYQTTS